MTEVRGNSCKHWAFTYNNYPMDWMLLFETIFLQSCKFVASREVGESGTPHIQGYLSLPTKQRFSEFGLPKEIHWEPAKCSPEANYIYCTKHGVPAMEKGFDPPYTMDITLRPWQLSLVHLLSSSPDDRTIMWIFETAGNTGKTTLQKYVHLNLDRVLCVSGKAADMKQGILAYSKLQEVLPRVILMNIPRCTDTDFVSWQGIEECKDMFFFSPKYEGGMVNGACPHVVIFANQSPPVHKFSMDRWSIFEIVDNQLVNHTPSANTFSPY